ncbi:MAG TPA: SDR family NAD(P)-dependent oxidoreductase [Mycobacteriales bacterium]|nr:SDR family NAD(P)-dependent oxidoreductase [Mycobacteriales bacterium]
MSPADGAAADSRAGAGNELAGRVALVTGGARGIGAAAAAALAAAGATVLVADIRDADGAAAVAALGPAAAYLRLDVTDEAAWAAVVDLVRARHQRLDVLVTSAGIAAPTPLLDLDAGQARAVLDVNVLGTLLGIRAAAPLMRAYGGSIVTVASVNGFLAPPGLTAYAASKWAVRGLTRSAAVELAPYRIRVNAVCPGSIETPITDGGGFDSTDWDAYARSIPLGRRGTAADVAAAIRYLAGDASSYVTGTDLVVDGGLLAGRTIPQRPGPPDTGG